MHIGQENLRVFQQLYLAHVGQELSEKEAEEKAARLVRLIELTFKPITKTDFDSIIARQEKIRASAS